MKTQKMVQPEWFYPRFAEEWRAALAGGFYDPLQEKIRKSFLHLPFLKFLQLEILSSPRCRILGVACPKHHQTLGMLALQARIFHAVTKHKLTMICRMSFCPLEVFKDHCQCGP